MTSDDCKNVFDVAIIGGGISGTYSAYRLRNTNQRIGLFEGSSRIGGRLYTYNLPCSPSHNLELGGMRFIPKHHVTISNLVSTLGLPTIPFPHKDKDGECPKVYYLRGKHLSQQDIMFGDVPYDLTPEEKKNQHRIWQFFLESLLGEEFKEDDDLFHKLDDPFLKTKDGILLHTLTTEEALNQVASTEGKAFAKDTSLNHSETSLTYRISATLCFRLLMAVVQCPGEIVTLQNGMSSLPERLKEEFEKTSLVHKTFFNHKLISIIKKDEGLYSLKFQCSPSKWDDSQFDKQKCTKNILARRVILALPLTALDNIQWYPFQTISHLNARSQIEVVALCKIFLLFDIPWWQEAGTSSANSVSDQSYSMSVDFGHKEGTFAVLVSYSNCGESKIFRKLQAQGQPIEGSAPGDMRVSTALRDFILEQLSVTYKIKRHKIPEPTGGVARFWETGAVACGRPGCLDVDLFSTIIHADASENVVVVGSDVAIGSGLEMWAEGGLRIVDDVLSTNSFFPVSD